MKKYLIVFLIETIIVTIYVVSLYVNNVSADSIPEDGPRCAFSDHKFMCTMVWIFLQLILVPLSLVLTKAISMLMNMYCRKK